MRIVAPRQRRVERLIDIQAQARDPPFALLNANQQLRQLRVGRRPNHQRNMRRAVENLLALLLRHAPQQADHLPVGMFLVMLQPVKNLLLRLVANRTGVEQNQRSRIGVIDLLVAALHQCADDLFRVMHIHLAAKRFEIERLHLFSL
jgi:hypothetical protein